ncbi:dihydroneopterin aldolase [Atopobacter sp. AH10]|uniref:dihydroneopterin aldolase n=1 Tax=Atopobacter sp. AH10 TaxID=2315861 RepID=UPI000EF1FE70|nr:dihydroneopterin aldolase [Atopobacter sp. AH10]RLK63334.1 dihydroneopterin aldolase [Atopobacter sp. AH10]
MYRILMKNMKFHSHIGVFEEEKKLGQAIELDLLVEVKKTPKCDSIEDTVSYADFYDIIKEEVENSRADLIETLAQSIVEAIKAWDTKGQLSKVNVKLRKIALPIDGILDYVQVEMGDDLND